MWVATTKSAGRPSIARLLTVSSCSLTLSRLLPNSLYRCEEIESEVPNIAPHEQSSIDSVGYFHSVFVMKEVKNTHGVPVKMW